MEAVKKIKGDTTDCRTEEGITVSIIDTISFLLGQLSKRNLESPNVKEAIKDFQTNGKFNIGAKTYTLFISQKPQTSFLKNGKRDYTIDEREQCSNCKRKIDPDENIWRTSDHTKLPPSGKYKGKKAKMIAIDVSLYKAIYCTDCTEKFDVIIESINKKSI